MLTLLSMPIGNLKDISLRALEALTTAEVVLCEDTRVAKKIFRLLLERSMLQILPHQTHQSFLQDKQFLSLHSHNEQHFLNTIDKSIFGREVVYLCDAGMPCISDPGAELVAKAMEYDIDFVVLPGACALNVAFCSSGLASTTFIFIGFLPHKRTERRAKILQCATLGLSDAYSVICYESPHRLLNTLADIALLLPFVRIILHKELTKMYEKRYFGTAKEILDKLSQTHICGEWVIIFDFSFKQTTNNATLSANASRGSISYEDVLMLQIEPKTKAKILSKISGQSVKEAYEMVLKYEK